VKSLDRLWLLASTEVRLYKRLSKENIPFHFKV